MKPTENRTAIILRFIHRHFIWMIIASYIVAAMMPGFGLLIRNVSFDGAVYLPPFGGAIIQCRIGSKNGRTDSYCLPACPAI
jgi:hypothetical protein